MTPEDNRRRQSNIKTLRVILILSFVYTGMWMLCHLMLGLTSPEARTTMLEV